VQKLATQQVAADEKSTFQPAQGKNKFFLDADKLANECNGKSWLIAYRQA